MAYQPHVLLVDEDGRSARRIQHELETAGLVVTIAEDAPKILRTLSQVHVDLVLIDHELPVRRVCAIIAKEGRPRTPIIVMASEASDLEVERLKQDCPLAAVIFKPFTIEKLVRVIGERCSMGLMAAEVK